MSIIRRLLTWLCKKLGIVTRTIEYIEVHAPVTSCGHCSYCKKVITHLDLFYLVHRTGMTSNYNKGKTTRRIALACKDCGKRRRIEKRTLHFNKPFN
jgi:hypothetical protein